MRGPGLPESSDSASSMASHTCHLGGPARDHAVEWSGTLLDPVWASPSRVGSVPSPGRRVLRDRWPIMVGLLPEAVSGPCHQFVPVSVAAVVRERATAFAPFGV
jgi:hypothetical protein